MTAALPTQYPGTPKRFRPRVHSKTMTSADTEYSITIPAGTKSFSLQCRDGTAFRLAFVTGKVATPTSPYRTILANTVYNSPADLQIPDEGMTMYVACASASKVIDCESWQAESSINAPVNTVPTDAFSTDEDTAVYVTGMSILDADVGESNIGITVAVDSGTVTLKNDVSSGITSGQISNNGSGTVTVTAALSAVNLTLAHANGVSFTPASNATGTVTLTLTTNDLGNSAAGYPLVDVDSVTIVVSAVNDPPVNTVPATRSTNEDTAFTVTGISITDTDASGAAVRVTLSATSGTLTLSTVISSGLESGDITNNGTGTVTVNATLSKINTTLAGSSGLVYTPTAQFNGTDYLTVLTNDLGNTGSGGAKTDVDTCAITVAAVNDPPVNTVPGSKSTNVDTAKAITGISITDVDAGSADVLLTLSVGHGSVAVLTNVASGLTSGQIADNGTGTVTITAPLSKINTTLANATGLVYTPASAYTGTDTLTVVTNDQGNTGSGVAQTDTDTVAIVVS